MLALEDLRSYLHDDKVAHDLRVLEIAHAQRSVHTVKELNELRVFDLLSSLVSGKQRPRIDEFFYIVFELG